MSYTEFEIRREKNPKLRRLFRTVMREAKRTKKSPDFVWARLLKIAAKRDLGQQASATKATDE